MYQLLIIYIVFVKIETGPTLNVYKMELARAYMIERASTIIMEKDPIDIKNQSETIYIRKNSFAATEKEPYFEDYCVTFELSLLGCRYSSTFYLQWYGDVLASPDELFIKKIRL